MNRGGKKESTVHLELETNMNYYDWFAQAGEMTAQPPFTPVESPKGNVQGMDQLSGMYKVSISSQECTRYG